MRTIRFIDRDGNEITSDGIRTHTELALIILDKNRAFLEEYKMSKIQDPVDFFIFNKGYIKLTERAFYKRCIFSSSKISEKQRRILDYYEKMDFVVDDLDIVDMEKHTR